MRADARPPPAGGPTPNHEPLTTNPDPHPSPLTLALTPNPNLQQAAPLLRAFWLAALLSTAEVVAWAEAPLPSGDAAVVSATQRVRRYAAPFVQWLQSAPVEDLAPAA